MPSDGELEVQFVAVHLGPHVGRKPEGEGALLLLASFDGEGDGALARREARVGVAHLEGLLALQPSEGDDQASYRLGGPIVDRHCTINGGS